MKLAQKIAVNYIRARLNMLAVVSSRTAAEKAFELFCTPVRKSKRKTPDIFTNAEKLSFEIDGIRVTGFRWNHPAEKKMLIVHGFESTVKNFDRYILPLVKKGYEILAFDAPAHGKSGGRQINLPMYIQMIEMINHLYGPIHSFLTHSFGGLATTHFLEKIKHDQSTRLVLVAPATETTTAIDLFFDFLHLSKKVRKEFDKVIFEKGGNWPDHYSVRRAIGNIHATVLWVHDKEDEMTPLSDALKVKDENYSHVEFVITEGLGHRKIYRDNNVVKQIIEFL